MTWRRAALAIAWLVAAAFGIYDLVALSPANAVFVVVAFAHFLFGYAWAHAIVARPLSMPLALFGIACAGAFTRVALAMGTVETYFVWAGPLAAIALVDTSRPRHIAYSALAFAAGFVALAWLAP